MTPDPIGGDTRDPQTLNKYAYVRNNPSNLIDPSGMYECGDNVDGQEQCSSQHDRDFEEARTNATRSSDPSVVLAASAYGGRNEDNGVTVSFDSSKGFDGQGSTVPISTSIGGQITHVEIQTTLSTSLKGDALERRVVHEGSHIEDMMGFLTLFRPGTLVGFQPDTTHSGVESIFYGHFVDGQARLIVP